MKDCNKGFMTLPAVIILVVIALLLGGGAYYAGTLPTMEKKGSNNQQDGAILPGNEVLNLSNVGLTVVPPYVFNRVGLQELDISHNLLKGALQSQIGQLRELKVLDASHNEMTGVPAEIGQLKELQVLDLSYNQLTGLPNELGNLQNLKTLDLQGNQYSQQDLDNIRSKLPPAVRVLVD